MIVGPTAVGKTDLAVEVALRLDGEILSADAMQVYRGLDIATDKPSLARRRGVVHHLIDLVEPHEPFSAALYRQFAHRALQEVRERGRLPIVCGGTGLYVRAFVDDRLPAGPAHDPQVRARLEEETNRLGTAAMHRRLAAIDPEAAARIHPNDARRIVRALEIFETTGTPASVLQAEGRQRARPLPAVWIGLTRPRDELYRRIDQRVDDQIRRGLVEETRRLLSAAGPARGTAMQALGYKEMAEYLAGRQSFAAAVERLKRATRHYARRQWIWFKAEPRLRWFDLSRYGGLEEAAAAVVAYARPLLERYGWGGTHPGSAGV